MPRAASGHCGHRAPRRGFTYIELMVAVAIMGVLAMSVVPLSDWLRQRSQESQLRDALRQIRSAIDAYRKAAEDGIITRPQGASLYPRSLGELVRGIEASSETFAGAGGGLRVETATSTASEKRKLYFLRRIPRDPLFPDPRVPAELTWGLRSSESPPDRPMPGRDVFDVYSLSPRQALDGSFYRTW